MTFILAQFSRDHELILTDSKIKNIQLSDGRQITIHHSAAHNFSSGWMKTRHFYRPRDKGSQPQRCCWPQLAKTQQAVHQIGHTT